MRQAFRLATAAFVTLGAASIAQAQTPLLRYTFDETSGAVIDTGTAPASNGGLHGGAARSTDTPGGFGFSLDLRDDTSTWDYVATAGDAGEVDGLSALTLSTWLKLEQYPGSGSSPIGRLATKQTSNDNFDGFAWNLNNQGIGTASTSNIRSVLSIGGPGAEAANAGSGFSNAFDASDWIFLAVTYDAPTGDIHFYSGDNDPGSILKLIGSANIAGVGVISDTNTPFGIGYTGASTADASVIGWQDDVRVYGSALDATQLNLVRLQNIPEPAAAGLAAAAAGLLLGRRRR